MKVRTKKKKKKKLSFEEQKPKRLARVYLSIFAYLADDYFSAEMH